MKLTRFQVRAIESMEANGWVVTGEGRMRMGRAFAPRLAFFFECGDVDTCYLLGNGDRKFYALYKAGSDEALRLRKAYSG